MADAGIERALLGMLINDPPPETVVAVADMLPIGAFDDPKHREIYTAVLDLDAAGAPNTPITVEARLRATGRLRQAGGAPYLVETVEAACTPPQATWHAERVAEAAELRMAIADAARLKQAAESGDPATLAKLRAELIGRWSSSPAGPVDDAAELDDLLSADEPEYDWIVPGLLERGDRVILTGPEGGGKSTLLRQIGVQLAAGIHPFSGDPITPARCLIVDLENSARQTRRKLRPLRLTAGDRYKPHPGLRIRVRPNGLNLLDPHDARWLLDLCNRHQPDVLITGPIYKLAAGDPTEEKTAKAVADLLDLIRAKVGCAVLLEAHTPHSTNGKNRPERPYGASLWLRWPEFGLYLSSQGHLRHWRGDRDERSWPAALQRGGQWPWTPVTRPRDLLWARIAQLCIDAGGQLSERDLAKLTGASQATVHRAITEHQAEWEALGGGEA